MNGSQTGAVGATSCDESPFVEEIDLGAWAVRYAELGWPVFPLRAKSKVPSIPAAHGRDDPARLTCKGECGRPGHGLWDATADVDRIARWWRRNPNDNIGLRTGDVFDVLDLDRLGQDDDSFAEMEKAGLEQTLLWIAETELLVAGTRKGIHIFVAPTGGGNRAGFVPGCDWRGKGGYVVAAPSEHPDGGRYVWHGWDGGEPPPLPTVPEDLARMISRDERQGADRARVALALCGIEGDSTTPYGRKALENACEAIRASVEGQRNHTLNAQAFGIFQLVAGREITEAEAIEALTDAAQDAGLNGREIEATLGSARNGGMAEPRVAPPPMKRKER